MLTVQDLIIKTLINSNFDGLISDCGECVCLIDDLMPCESSEIIGCQPAYIVHDNDLTEDDKSIMNEMGYDYMLSIIKR